MEEEPEVEVEIEPEFTLFDIVEPINFVGRTKISDSFFEWISDFVISKSPQTHWIHIFGPPGSGKTSLMQKLIDMSEMERVKVIKPVVPLFPNAKGSIFLEMFEQIDQMIPDWRSFFQRRKKSPIADLDETDLHNLNKEEIFDDELQLIENKIFENMSAVDEKLKENNTVVGVFLDDIDRFVNNQDGGNALLINLMAKRFKNEGVNIYFVTSSIDNTLTRLKVSEAKEKGYVTLFELLNFDYNDADLMIRRRSNHPKDDRDAIVQSSTRFPFDLAIRELMFSEGEDSKQLTVENVSIGLNLTDKMIDLFTEFSKEDVNLFKSSKVRDYLTAEEINELLGKEIIALEGPYATFPSNALWDIISTTFLPIDVRTEMILKISRMEEQVVNGNLPSVKDIEDVRKNITFISDPSLLFELSTKLSESAKAALTQNLVHAAWDMLDIARLGYEKTEDYERLAELNEDFGREFALLDIEYLSALAYQFSANNFLQLTPPKKIRAEANFREAGNRFRREAEKMSPESFHIAMRSIFRKAIDAFVAANEPGSAKEVLKLALETFEAYPQHQEYLKKIPITI